MKTIKIFVASPSDVEREREITKAILKRLKRRYKKYYELEWVFWEDKPLSAINSYQYEIDDPSSTDIVMIILWSKLGSNLPPEFKGKITEKQPITGVEWEFEEAKYHNNIHGKPHILVYKKNNEILSVIGDDEEYKRKTKDKDRLDDFMQYWFTNKDGTPKGAVHQSTSLVEFENKVEVHLDELIKNHQEGIILLDTEIKKRIDDLKNESLAAFKNQKVQESLKNSKKCAEFICRIIYLEQERYFDSEKYNSNPYKFIDEITDEAFKDQERDFARIYLKSLIFNGRQLSVLDSKYIEMSSENVKLSNINLQRLLNWLFNDYLNRPIPKELIRYTSKYNIILSFNNADRAWVDTLKENLETQNYRVYLKDSKKQDSRKKINQAFEEIKTVILICSTKKSDKNWLRDEQLKLKQQKSLKFKTIYVSPDKSCKGLKKITYIGFSDNYKNSFNNLVNEIEEKHIRIILDEIIEPVVHNSCFGIKKSFCFFGMVSVFILGISGFYIFKTDEPIQKNIEAFLYTASSDRSTYNVIGDDIAKYIAKDAGITLKIKESSGSYNSLGKLTQSNKNRLTMAIVQADSIQKYISDPKNRGFAKKLKVVAPLYKEEVHFIVRDDSNLTHFHQIKNERIDIGKENSGTEISAQAVYKEMFFDDNNILSLNMKASRSNVSFQDALERLKNRKTDVIVMVAGQPLPTLINEKSIKLLTYNPKLLLKKQKELGLLIDDQTRLTKISYSQSYIYPQSYKWNDEIINTLNTRAYLVVYDDGKTNQKLLEKFTKAYIKNLHKIKDLAIKGKVHQKWLEIPEYLEMPKHLDHKLPSDLSYSPIVKKTWDSINPSSPTF